VVLCPNGYWTQESLCWQKGRRFRRLWKIFDKRRNWLHVGSERAGPRVAAILSVIETCRRYQIPIRQYLSSVLPGLAEFPANRISELTPGGWARGQS
jgi:hypothetical protein